MDKAGAIDWPQSAPSTVSNGQIAIIMQQSIEHPKHGMCALGQVPPYCHLADGRAPEEAAAEALRAMGSKHAADALAIVWRLRRVAAADGGGDARD